MNTEILTRDEAADILGISPYTLKDWAARRQIGSVKIGRDIRFTRSQIEEYIQMQTRPMEKQDGQTRRSKASSRKKA